MWGLFRTRCGCERLLAIPNPPPQRYVLPMKVTLGLYASDPIPGDPRGAERQFARNGFTFDGYALYLEVE